ncbi:MAG: hypothetical protein ACYDH2_13220, partial [Anaerolineaceae bacterium]
MGALKMVQGSTSEVNNLDELHSLWERVLVSLLQVAPIQLPGFVDFYSEKVVPVSYSENNLVLGVEDEDSLLSIYVGWKSYVAQSLQFVTGIMRSTDSVQVVLAPHLFKNDSLDVDEVVQIERRAQPLVDAILQSYRIVSIPRPVLWWLPILGPSLSSLYIAARQICFTCSKDNSGIIPLDIALSQFERWSGLSEKTVSKLIDSKELRSFVGLVGEKKPRSILQDGKFKRVRYKFQVAIDIPLLPEMEESLEKYLLSVGILDDPERALLITKKAIKENDNLFAPVENPQPPKDWDSWNQTNHTVSGVINRILVENPISPVCQVLISELTEMIMPQNFGSVHIPWYRLEYWFPLLGQSIGWFTVLLKSLTFYNPETGEKRTSIKSSFARFSSKLQLQERLVKDWFSHPKNNPSPPDKEDPLYDQKYKTFLNSNR